MSTIRSIEDLNHAREEALRKRDLRASSGTAHVIVGMGTCSIAAGAKDTMKAILDAIEKESLPGITVSETGCIGLCGKEPIVQVVLQQAAMVTYGKVTPEVAERILKEHVLNGKAVSDHVISI
jgi:NADP-reducing hydrogenase subunit HndB